MSVWEFRHSWHQDSALLQKYYNTLWCTLCTCGRWTYKTEDRCFQPILRCWKMFWVFCSVIVKSLELSDNTRKVGIYIDVKCPVKFVLYIPFYLLFFIQNKTYILTPSSHETITGPGIPIDGRERVEEVSLERSRTLHESLRFSTYMMFD